MSTTVSVLVQNRNKLRAGNAKIVAVSHMEQDVSYVQHDVDGACSGCRPCANSILCGICSEEVVNPSKTLKHWNMCSKHYAARRARFSSTDVDNFSCASNALLDHQPLESEGKRCTGKRKTMVKQASWWRVQVFLTRT